MFVLCLLPVVELGFFKLEFFVVELDLAEMACVSRNIRTTRSESLAAYQSSVSVLSVRPRILVRTVSYFCFRILIGCLGILGLLRRRMVVVSHLFRHRRC